MPVTSDGVLAPKDEAIVHFIVAPDNGLSADVILVPNADAASADVALIIDDNLVSVSAVLPSNFVASTDVVTVANSVLKSDDGLGLTDDWLFGRASDLGGDNGLKCSGSVAGFLVVDATSLAEAGSSLARTSLSRGSNLLVAVPGAADEDGYFEGRTMEFFGVGTAGNESTLLAEAVIDCSFDSAFVCLFGNICTDNFSHSA